MRNKEMINKSGYLDMTAYLAVKNADKDTANIESETYLRGDIFLANLNPIIGSVQGGIRPVLVLQNNIGNLFCPTLIVAPITSKTAKKISQPTHCRIDNVPGLRESSIVLTEQITTIDKRQIKKNIGKVEHEQMVSIEEALKVSLGIDVPAEFEAP